MQIASGLAACQEPSALLSHQTTHGAASTPQNLGRATLAARDREPLPRWWPGGRAASPAFTKMAAGGFRHALPPSSARCQGRAAAASLSAAGGAAASERPAGKG